MEDATGRSCAFWELEDATETSLRWEVARELIVLATIFGWHGCVLHQARIIIDLGSCLRASLAQYGKTSAGTCSITQITHGSARGTDG